MSVVSPVKAGVVGGYGLYVINTMQKGRQKNDTP